MTEERRGRRLPAAAIFWLAVLSYGVLLFLQSLMIFSADDFYYATFWDGGISSFLQKNIVHYNSFNGRVLVHLAAQCVLAFRSSLVCAVFATGVLWTICFLAQKLSPVKNAASGLSFLVPVLCIFSLDKAILRESLLWTSSFYNYFFPMILVLGALLLQQAWKKRGISSWGAILGCLLLHFAAGATTELYGAIILCCTALLLVRDLLARQQRVGCSSLCGLSSLIGYSTIYLSPATWSRVRTELLTPAASQEGLLQRLPSAWNKVGQILWEQAGWVALLLLFACFGARLLFKKFSPLLLAEGPAAAILILTCLWVPGQEGDSLRLTIMIISFVLAGLALLMREETASLGALLLSGLLAIAMMLPTKSLQPRTVIPLVLSQALTAAFLLQTAAGELSQKRNWISALCAGALTVGGIFLLLPSAPGFLEASQTERENLGRIRQSRETGVLYYCMDYDLEYCHYPMFLDGDSYGNYQKCYHLENTVIYMESENMQPIYYKGARLTSLPLRQGTETLFPFRAILEAVGGTVEWDLHKGIYGIFGSVQYRLTGTACTYSVSGGQEQICWLTSQQVRQWYYTQMFSEKLFREVFGIAVIWDEAQQCYQVNVL